MLLLGKDLVVLAGGTANEIYRSVPALDKWGEGAEDIFHWQSITLQKVSQEFIEENAK